MKRLLVAIAALALSSAAYSQNLSGTYLTEECNTKTSDGIIKVTYTFVNDSLYIDAYPSGCGLVSMSIKRTTRDYVAIETVYKEDEPEMVAYIKIYHLEFLPCAWNKHCLAVYRDGVVVDIIRKIP